jgi:hypothetical protein
LTTAFVGPEDRADVGTFWFQRPSRGSATVTNFGVPSLSSFN